MSQVHVYPPSEEFVNQANVPGMDAYLKLYRDAAADPDSIPKYAAGTWEPKEAEDLINRDGRKWRRL